MSKHFNGVESVRPKRTKNRKDPSSLSESLSPTSDDTDSDVTDTAESVADSISCTKSSHRLIAAKTNSEELEMIHTLHINYDLQSKLARHLLRLCGFEIVIVCDDSGTMITPVDKTTKTRWNELCEIVKRVLGIAIMFDTNGVDIYFLNGDEYPKIKNPQDVDHAFERTPSGYTRLVPVLHKIFQSKLANPRRDKKLLVLVATDGRPTDDNGDDNVEELEYLMRHTRNPETTYVSFLLCTDEQECVDYLEQWDQTMEHVDVTDDYDTELRKIRRCQEDDNYPFSKDDYIVKALIGSIVPKIDRLNQEKIDSMSANEDP